MLLDPSVVSVPVGSSRKPALFCGVILWARQVVPWSGCWSAKLRRRQIWRFPCPLGSNKIVFADKRGGEIVAKYNQGTDA